MTAALKWSIDSDDWNLLGFEHVSGHHVDYSPGSPDLAKLVDSMRTLQELPCPAVDLKLAEKRWASFSDTPDLFAGDHLLHTEWSPSNVLVNDTALFVDWAWATRGAAWIDPACWVVWLIASGHPPQDAESWANQVPSWRSAPANSLDAFAAAQAALWRGIAEADPEPWIEGIAAAARRWSESRLTA
ncbi:aminoglycoside phosphotransferase [Amycolatopsis sp. NPDC059657]|uniref:aminoglycoside phosphotransferase n=1 Tax=Amycolatopsis sp. NPDC059657 TaxID=3346899 RepID=UPI00366C7505